MEWTNKKMGMAVGSLFVQDHFNHESRVVALEMIHGIRQTHDTTGQPTVRLSLDSNIFTEKSV